MLSYLVGSELSIMHFGVLAQCFSHETHPIYIHSSMCPSWIKMMKQITQTAMQSNSRIAWMVDEDIRYFGFFLIYLNIVYICVRLYKLLGDWPSGRTTLVRNHSFCFYMLADLAHSVHRLASYHSVALIAFATPLQMHGNEQIRKTSKLRRWWRWLFGRKITFH